MCSLACLLLGLLALQTVTGEEGCPQDWEHFQGSCYALGFSEVMFSIAQEDCNNNGGYLVEITSEAENNFVKDLLKREAYDSETSAWIGANQGLRGDWRYSESSSDLAFTDWATPSRRRASRDRKCAVSSREQDWAWTAKNCRERSANRTFVCERSPLQRACFDGSCYELVPRLVRSFRDAQEICEPLNGYLVEINSQQESEFVKKFLDGADVPRARFQDSATVWLGATDEGSEDDFRWDSGSGSFDFKDWATGEPNNSGVGYLEGNEDCVVMDGSKSWKWNDIMCDLTESAVLCESPDSVTE